MRNLFSLVLVGVLSAASLAEDQPASSKVTARIVETRPTPPTDPSVLKLEEVVGIALTKNPAVQSASHLVSAERAKIPQAKALPDPTFGVGWMGNPRPFSVQSGDPSSYRSVSAVQTLPFPGRGHGRAC